MPNIAIGGGPPVGPSSTGPLKKGTGRGRGTGRGGGKGRKRGRAQGNSLVGKCY